MKNAIALAGALPLVLGKDWTNINNVINGLELELELNVEPQIVDIDIIGTPGTAEAIVGEIGNCRDILITDGGDLAVSGGFNTPNEEYQLDVDITGFQFECTIPLTVELRTRGDEDVTSWNIGDGDGTLTFRSTSVSLSQALIATSADMRNLGPENTVAGACAGDPGALTFTGENIGEINFLFFPIDITGDVLGALEADPGIIGDQIAPLLCDLVGELAVTLGDLVNDLGDLLDVADPLEAGADGSVPALAWQNAFDSAGKNLYDFTDASELINGILFPGGDDLEKPFYYDLLDIFFEAPEGVTEYDSVLNVLANILGTELNAGGDIDSFNVLGLFEEGIEIAVNLTLLDTLVLDLQASVSQLDVGVSDRPGVPVLSNLVALAAQTAGIPRATIGALSIVLGADLGVVVSNDPTLLPEGTETILNEPFSFSVTDVLGAALDWTGDEGINAKAAAFLAIDLDSVNGAQLGPLLENLLGCLLGVLDGFPVVTGVGLGSTEQTIGLDLVGIEEADTEAILVLVNEIVDAIVPVATAWIPKGIQLAAEAFVVDNGELIGDLIPEADRQCPAADDSATGPFDFSTGLVADVSAAVTPEVVADVLAVIETDADGNLAIDLSDEPLSFVITVPYPEDADFTQELTITLEAATVGVAGLAVDEFTILSAAASLTDNIQDLRNEVEIGSAANPVSLGASMTISAAAPVRVSGTGAGIGGTYPQNNVLQLGVSVERVYALVDLLLTYSEFDVMSTPLGELLNLDCWTGKLGNGGGVTLFDAALGGLAVSGSCSSCDTDYVAEVVATITNSANFAGLEAGLSSELNTVTSDVVASFEGANFATTVATAADLCSSGESGDLLDIATDLVQFLVEFVLAFES